MQPDPSWRTIQMGVPTAANGLLRAMLHVCQLQHIRSTSAPRSMFVICIVRPAITPGGGGGDKIRIFDAQVSGQTLLIHSRTTRSTLAGAQLSTCVGQTSGNFADDSEGRGIRKPTKLLPIGMVR